MSWEDPLFLGAEGLFDADVRGGGGEAGITGCWGARLRQGPLEREFISVGKYEAAVKVQVLPGSCQPVTDLRDRFVGGGAFQIPLCPSSERDNGGRGVFTGVFFTWALAAPVLVLGVEQDLKMDEMATGVHS